MVSPAGSRLCPLYSNHLQIPKSLLHERAQRHLQLHWDDVSPPPKGWPATVSKSTIWILLPRCEITSHVTAQATAISQNLHCLKSFSSELGEAVDESHRMVPCFSRARCAALMVSLASLAGGSGAELGVPAQCWGRERACDPASSSKFPEDRSQPAGPGDPFLLAAAVCACNSVTTTPQQLRVHPTALPRQTLFNLRSARLSAFFLGEAFGPRVSFPSQLGSQEQQHPKVSRAEEAGWHHVGQGCSVRIPLAAGNEVHTDREGCTPRKCQLESEGCLKTCKEPGCSGKACNVSEQGTQVMFLLLPGLALEMGKHILHAQHHHGHGVQMLLQDNATRPSTCPRGQNVPSQSCLGKIMLEIKLKGI